MCAKGMLLDCWYRNDVSQNDLGKIITEFAIQLMKIYVNIFDRERFFSGTH